MNNSYFSITNKWTEKIFEHMSRILVSQHYEVSVIQTYRYNKAIVALLTPKRKRNWGFHFRTLIWYAMLLQFEKYPNVLSWNLIKHQKSWDVKHREKMHKNRHTNKKTRTHVEDTFKRIRDTSLLVQSVGSPSTNRRLDSPFFRGEPALFLKELGTPLITSGIVGLMPGAISRLWPIKFGSSKGDE